MKDFLAKHWRKFLYLMAGAIHLALIFMVVDSPEPIGQEPLPAQVFKLIDARELPPPPPEALEPDPVEPPPVETPPSQEITRAITEGPADDILETEEELPEPSPNLPVEPQYLAQHHISVVPVIDRSELLSRINYPEMARRQGIEGVVFLELYIDSLGSIRKIEVLRDPGYGFAEAALEAFRDIRATPALANGDPVAVRFRYPVRFSLN